MSSLKLARETHETIYELYMSGLPEISAREVNAVAWLIEQVEKLESHAPDGRNYTNAQYVELLKENERYRKALEFYASPISHREGKHIEGNEYEMPLVNKDRGFKARQALEETK